MTNHSSTSLNWPMNIANLSEDSLQLFRYIMSREWRRRFEINQSRSKNQGFLHIIYIWKIIWIQSLSSVSNFLWNENLISFFIFKPLPWLLQSSNRWLANYDKQRRIHTHTKYKIANAGKLVANFTILQLICQINAIKPSVVVQF